MKTKYKVTFYKIGKPSNHCYCTRTYNSTRKFALRHLFKQRVIWFSIKRIK